MAYHKMNIYFIFCRKDSEGNTPLSSPRKRRSARGTPSAMKEPTTTSHDDEMLENELESIFSAGKIAMKGIFKDEEQDSELNDSLKKVIFVLNGVVCYVGLLTLRNLGLNFHPILITFFYQQGRQ